MGDRQIKKSHEGNAYMKGGWEAMSWAMPSWGQTRRKPGWPSLSGAGSVLTVLRALTIWHSAPGCTNLPIGTTDRHFTLCPEKTLAAYESDRIPCSTINSKFTHYSILITNYVLHAVQNTSADFMKWTQRLDQQWKNAPNSNNRKLLLFDFLKTNSPCK